MTHSKNMKQTLKKRITTIYMAHRLGIKIIDEGVEIEEQLDLFRDFNCEYLQGYLFVEPMRESNFTEYLKNNG